MPTSRVREYMTGDPVTLPPDAPLREAVELVMVRRIRHIPIVDEARNLVGIITDRDVKRSLPSPLSLIAAEEYETILESTPVSRVMTREPITIGADAKVVEAVELMLSDKIGGLPVLDEARLVGMFTERDALRHYLELLRAAGTGG
jgi:acetoin utilization protein AcuB